MSNKVGILDPEGKNKNPLNNKSYSDEYKTLANIWKNFPAYKDAEKFIKNIYDYNVLSVVSGTGSGKTVLFPKYTLHVFSYKKKVMVILPKQILAKSSAIYAAKTMDVEVGQEIGFK